MTTILKWRTKCLKQRIDALAAEIARVSQKHHPYVVPKIVYGALNRVLDELLESIDSAEALYGKSSDPDTALQLYSADLRVAEHDLSFAVSLFRNCDRVDSSRVPFEILGALTAAAQELLGEPCRLILHLSSVYNYKIYSVRAWFEEAGWEAAWDDEVARAAQLKEIGSRPSDVLILVFPSYEVGAVALHAAAAHELGHVLAARWLPSIGAIAKPLIEKYHFDSLQDMNAHIADRLVTVVGGGRDYLHDRVWTETHRRLAQVPLQWVVELASDLIATRLVGPAFLAAFERITLGSSSASDSHPPDYIRRELIGRYVRTHMSDIAGDTAWAELLQVRKEESSGGDWVHKIAERVIRAAYDDLVKLTSAVHSPLLPATDGPDVKTDVNDVHHPLDAFLNRTERCLQLLIPPSCDCDIPTQHALADHFWLFFYSVWRFRMNEAVYSQFLTDHNWNDNHGARGEDALNSLLLHSLQSLELKLRLSPLRPQMKGVAAHAT